MDTFERPRVRKRRKSLNINSPVSNPAAPFLFPLTHNGRDNICILNGIIQFLFSCFKLYTIGF